MAQINLINRKNINLFSWKLLKTFQFVYFMRCTLVRLFCVMYTLGCWIEAIHSLDINFVIFIRKWIENINRLDFLIFLMFSALNEAYGTCTHFTYCIHCTNSSRWMRKPFGRGWSKYFNTHDHYKLMFS